MMAQYRPQPKGSRGPPRVSSWFSPFPISAAPSVASSLSACGAAANGTGSSPHRGADGRATSGVARDGTDGRTARRTPTRTYHRPRRHGIAWWRWVISERWVLCLRRLCAENPAARNENKRLAKHGSPFAVSVRSARQQNSTPAYAAARCVPVINPRLSEGRPLSHARIGELDALGGAAEADLLAGFEFIECRSAFRL